MGCFDQCFRLFARSTTIKDSHNRLTYQNAEDTLLDQMEGILSLFDNAVALQALFPNNRSLKALRNILKHTSSIYIFLLLMYIKRAFSKIRKLNKYIRIVKTEIILGIKTADKVLERLYREKAKSVIDMVGYISDFILNISLLFPRLKVGRFLTKILGAISWVATIARFMDEDDEVVEQIEKRYEST